MAHAAINTAGLFVYPATEEITGSAILEFMALHTARLPRYTALKNLYESNAPILYQADKADFKPDNRLVVNYAKYIVDTFNGYFIGIPVKVSHDDEKTNARIDDFMTENDMDDTQSELSKICSIYGHGYEIIFQDEDKKTNCIYNNPLDMFVVYEDTIRQTPLFAVRYLIEIGRASCRERV